jgi:hypothetical protein
MRSRRGATKNKLRSNDKEEDTRQFKPLVTSVFPKGRWPSREDIAQCDGAPMLLKGFAEGMAFPQKVQDDEYLYALERDEAVSVNDSKLTVRTFRSQGAHDESSSSSGTSSSSSGSGSNSNSSVLERITPYAKNLNLTMHEFLDAYETKKVSHMAAYGLDFDVSTAGTSRDAANLLAGSPFLVYPGLREIIPPILPPPKGEDASSSSSSSTFGGGGGSSGSIGSSSSSSGGGGGDGSHSSSAGGDETSCRFDDIVQHFHGRGLRAHNLAMWMSSPGKVVHTGTHYDDYTTLSIQGGSGTKTWYLAPPSPWLSSQLETSRYRKGGEPQNTAHNFTPWDVGGADDEKLDGKRGGGLTASPGLTAELRGWFHEVTVTGGDLLIVPKGWWHAVVTNDRCVVVNWWWTHNKELFDEMARVQKGE